MSGHRQAAHRSSSGSRDSPVTLPCCIVRSVMITRKEFGRCCATTFSTEATGRLSAWNVHPEICWEWHASWPAEAIGPSTSIEGSSRRKFRRFASATTPCLEIGQVARSRSRRCSRKNARMDDREGSRAGEFRGSLRKPRKHRIERTCCANGHKKCVLTRDPLMQSTTKRPSQTQHIHVIIDL